MCGRLMQSAASGITGGPSGPARNPTASAVLKGHARRRASAAVCPPVYCRRVDAEQLRLEVDALRRGGEETAVPCPQPRRLVRIAAVEDGRAGLAQEEVTAGRAQSVFGRVEVGGNADGACWAEDGAGNIDPGIENVAGGGEALKVKRPIGGVFKPENGVAAPDRDWLRRWVRRRCEAGRTLYETHVVPRHPGWESSIGPAQRLRGRGNRHGSFEMLKIVTSYGTHHHSQGDHFAILYEIRSPMLRASTSPLETGDNFERRSFDWGNKIERH